MHLKTSSVKQQFVSASMYQKTVFVWNRIIRETQCLLQLGQPSRSYKLHDRCKTSFKRPGAVALSTAIHQPHLSRIVTLFESRDNPTLWIAPEYFKYSKPQTITSIWFNPSGTNALLSSVPFAQSPVSSGAIQSEYESNDLRNAIWWSYHTFIVLYIKVMTHLMLREKIITSYERLPSTGEVCIVRWKGQVEEKIDSISTV